ncbi:MAG TPA: hypothetical protein VM434_09510, partial [Beijerinckiaceae bacterium]|nr:hypothetical protein [Beijerinckiaceae bacterium]
MNDLGPLGAAATETAFKFGIEEEFFVSSADKRDAARTRMGPFVEAAKARLSALLTKNSSSMPNLK